MTDTAHLQPDRMLGVRDPNPLVAVAALKAPGMSDSEVVRIAGMRNVSEDVLRIIGGNRAWMKSYQVVVGLTKNPKTPLAMSLNLLNQLTLAGLKNWVE